VRPCSGSDRSTFISFMPLSRVGLGESIGVDVEDLPYGLPYGSPDSKMDFRSKSMASEVSAWLTDRRSRETVDSTMR
jgi:hypothetical protein